MTHDIGVDFKPAAEMKSMQSRVLDEENISNYLTQFSIYESFSNSRKKNLRP
jgi:hypothetical protein